MKEFWFEIAKSTLAPIETLGGLYHVSVGHGMRRSGVLKLWPYMAVKRGSNL